MRGMLITKKEFFGGEIMANTISLKGIPTSEWLSMSNGATDVFIDILKLCHQSLPSNRPSHSLTAWMIKQHEFRIGDGFSGFDIADMPWNKNNFGNQHECLLSVVDTMRDKSMWSKLDYEPNEEILFRCISEFRNLLERMKLQDE